MTVRSKLTVLMAALVFANLAIWGSKHLAYTLDPILRALGA